MAVLLFFLLLFLVDVVRLGLVEDVQVFRGLLVQGDDAFLELSLLAPLVLLEQVGVLDVVLFIHGTGALRLRLQRVLFGGRTGTLQRTFSLGRQHVVTLFQQVVRDASLFSQDVSVLEDVVAVEFVVQLVDTLLDVVFLEL